jgi:hypothetical protein
MDAPAPIPPTGRTTKSEARRQVTEPPGTSVMRGRRTSHMLSTEIPYRKGACEWRDSFNVLQADGWVFRVTGGLRLIRLSRAGPQLPHAKSMSSPLRYFNQFLFPKAPLLRNATDTHYSLSTKSCRTVYLLMPTQRERERESKYTLHVLQPDTAGTAGAQPTAVNTDSLYQGRHQKHSVKFRLVYLHCTGGRRCDA